jgi:hypothetical protein
LISPKMLLAGNNFKRFQGSGLLAFGCYPLLFGTAFIVLLLYGNL